MDYFYASGFANGSMPGLNDQYLELTYTPCSYVEIKADYHYFSTVKRININPRVFSSKW